MKTTPKCRFTKPATLEYLKDKVFLKSTPVKTRQQTDWSVALWMEWRLNPKKMLKIVLILPHDFVICPRKK